MRHVARTETSIWEDEEWIRSRLVLTRQDVRQEQDVTNSIVLQQESCSIQHCQCYIVNITSFNKPGQSSC